MIARFSSASACFGIAMAAFMSGGAFAQSAPGPQTLAFSGETNRGRSDQPLSLVPQDRPAAPSTSRLQPPAIVVAPPARPAPLDVGSVKPRQAAIAPTEPSSPLVNVPMPPPRPFKLAARPVKKTPTQSAIVEVSTRAAPVQVLVPQAALSDNAPRVARVPSLIQQDVESAPEIRQASLSPVIPRAPVLDEQPSEPASNLRGASAGGFLKQIPSVSTGCLRPELLALIRKAGRHFGGTPVITSGFRAGGRRGSYHRKCMAADMIIPGVPKTTLAAYFRSLPESGGVGLYCHNNVVHIDVAEPRNWTYCGIRRTSFSLRRGGWGDGEHVSSRNAPARLANSNDGE